MKAVRVLSVFRRLTLFLALSGLFYLYWRFELLSMPDHGCSPLMRFSPGSSLLVDKHPREYVTGDAAFFLSPRGSLHLGVVESVGRDGYWLSTDNPACEGEGSDELGVIVEARMQGRILFAFSPN